MNRPIHFNYSASATILAPSLNFKANGAMFKFLTALRVCLNHHKNLLLAKPKIFLQHLKMLLNLISQS